MTHNIALKISDIISWLTLVFNILIFIANVIISHINNKNSVRRSIDLNFYEMTMLKALRDYFSFIGVINTQYSDLVNEYTKTGDKDNCRELTEKAITALDNLNEKIQNEISPYLFGFSLNIGEKINNIFEDYYDAVTNIFSKYSQPDMNHTKLSSIQRDFSKETKDIVSMIYKVVKENCPK